MSSRIPLSLVTDTLASTLLVNPGKTSTVYARVQVKAGLSEAGNQPTSLAVCLLVDCSGSTGSTLGQGTILDETLEAAKQAVEFLQRQVEQEGARHHISIVRFNEVCGQRDVLIPMTLCDETGGRSARQAMDSIISSGGTNFSNAIERGIEILKTAPLGCVPMLIKFTDGQDSTSSKAHAVVLAEEARQLGIDFRVGALGLKPEDRQHCVDLAGDKFQPLATAADVQQFFVGAALLSQAAITNAVLTLTPPTTIKVLNLARVTRGTDGQQNTDFLDAAADSNNVKLDGIAGGQTIECCFGLKLTQPDNIKTGRRSLGKIVLTGDIPSEDITGVVLCEKFIEVEFATQLAGAANEQVVRVMNLAAAQRELAAFASTGDRSHLDKARQTLALDNSAAAAALLAQLGQIESTTNAADATTAAKRATQGFDAAAAAAALQGMM